MLSDFLDDINDALVRAIVGVFRFILVRLPQLIWEWCVDYFPLLAKSVLAVVLFAIIQLTIFGPSFTVLIPLLNPEFHDHPFVQWLAGIHRGSILVHILIGCWTILALSGAVWGTAYLKRKLRPSRPPMGVAGGVFLVAVAMSFSCLLAVAPQLLAKASLLPAWENNASNAQTARPAVAEIEDFHSGSSSETTAEVSRVLTSADGQREITASIVSVNVESREVILRLQGQSETKRAKFESFSAEDIAFLERYPASTARNTD